MWMDSHRAEFYVKKPVQVRAIRWTGENRNEVRCFLNGKAEGGVLNINMDNSITIFTLEGEMKANVGDMIIKGVNGVTPNEIFVCKPDIFAKTYELH